MAKYSDFYRDQYEQDKGKKPEVNEYSEHLEERLQEALDNNATIQAMFDRSIDLPLVFAFTNFVLDKYQYHGKDRFIEKGVRLSTYRGYKSLRQLFRKFMEAKAEHFKSNIFLEPLSYEHHIQMFDKKDPYTVLRELLAIIHGDGGHYTQKVGTSKSVVDAIRRLERNGYFA